MRKKPKKRCRWQVWGGAWGKETVGLRSLLEEVKAKKGLTGRKGEEGIEDSEKPSSKIQIPLLGNSKKEEFHIGEKVKLTPRDPGGEKTSSRFNKDKRKRSKEGFPGNLKGSPGVDRHRRTSALGPRKKSPKVRKSRPAVQDLSDFEENRQRGVSNKNQAGRKQCWEGSQSRKGKNRNNLGTGGVSSGQRNFKTGLKLREAKKGNSGEAQVKTAQGKNI